MFCRRKCQLPPLPTPSNLHLTKESLGWLNGTFLAQISFVVIIVAIGHSLLAMSGFETLAQVYREVAYPKMKNLRITANIVCTYAVICTGVISVLAVMIIPDSTRSRYYDNMIGGLVTNLVGPTVLKLGFHIFVVIVGVLILAGAVNTSLIGVNGVMNRVAEDGVLLDWFRKPHHKFGTTYRILNMMALLQIITIIISRGDVYLLGEAYAFGVVWSFALKALGVLVLRYQRHDQEYKMPFNITLGRVEIPIGLAATTSILFLVAIANLFSKKIATIYGVSFTIVLYILFLISEHVNARKKPEHRADLEKFNLDHQAEIGTQTLHARPGCVLVAVRDYRRLWHLNKALEKTNMRRHDIVVMTVRQLSAGAGRIRSSRRPALRRLRAGAVLARGLGRRKTRQERRTAGGPGRRSLRRHGADSRAAAGVEAGGGRLRAHGVRGAGQPHRPGLGASSRAAPRFFARNHQSRPALDLREPRASSAAAMAGGRRPPASHLAAPVRAVWRRVAAPPPRRGRRGSAEARG